MKKIIALTFFLLICSGCFAKEELSKQATAFYSDNNFQKTMELLLQIDESKRTAQDWLLLGNLLEEKGEINNAIFMYQKATLVDKNFYKAYYNLANIYLSQDRYNNAVEYYQKALSINKKNPYVYYNLACAYIKQGEIKKAKTQLLKAVELKNDVAEFHYNLAFVYQSLNKVNIAQTYLDNYNKLTGNSED